MKTDHKQRTKTTNKDNTMKNIKTIAVKIKMVGSGVVSFDSSDLGFAVNQSINTTVKSRHSNVNYAKSSFHLGKIGEKEGMIRSLRISSDCMRHAIHIEGHPFHTPNVASNDVTKVHYLANPDTLLRGYLIADTGERRKSCYSITSAKEVSGASPTLETLSRSGAKDTSGVEGKGDTTLFTRDNVGDTQYEAEMFIDLSELSMISLSDLADRRAIMDDLVPEYSKALSENLGSTVPAPEYFIKRGSAYLIPEKGIQLTEEQVRLLVKTLLKKVAAVNINKSQTGYAKVSSILVAGIEDVLEETEDESFVAVYKDGKFSSKALDSAMESFHNLYTRMDFADAERMLKEYEENNTLANKKSAEKKKAKGKKGKEEETETNSAE